MDYGKHYPELIRIDAHIIISGEYESIKDCLERNRDAYLGDADLKNDLHELPVSTSYTGLDKCSWRRIAGL